MSDNNEVEYFKDFAFDGFWEDDEFALDKYVGAPATDQQLFEAEKQLGYKLPSSYKWLVKRHNGGTPAVGNRAWVTGIFGIDANKMYSLFGELGTQFWISEWGYPDIGIAICDTPSAGHQMVFLDYRQCGKEGEPSVVMNDQEADYEITLLDDNFENFIRRLPVRNDD